jgi:DNA-binding transcriptional MerR regulator
VSASWTIQQLGEAVEARLAGEEAPANGQVRAVPDERSIRYYTTLGLLDRPMMRGRAALYGRRHLAQLIAIKRLQAEGRTLAEIQRVLPTFDDAELAQRSGVELGATRQAAGRRDFWRAPAAVATEAPPEPGTRQEAAPRGPAPASFAPVLEVMLAPGVRLTLQTARPATDADAAALIAAASPLLAELARRHLVPRASGTESAPPEPEDRE